MRGTRTHVSRQIFLRGIIPADAGNTHESTRGITPAEDHPRGCGEHEAPLREAEQPAGSSPRMRGTQGVVVVADRNGGIIPADAEKTQIEMYRHFLSKDHPRGCGEHLVHAPELCICLGSSPRMRGTHGQLCFGGGWFRIIPADAGNTSFHAGSHQQKGDHPRGCGEHRHGHKLRCRDEGSSPRMRGTQAGAFRGRVGVRIIPADAGNTHHLHRRAWCVWDHPRGCGEHLAQVPASP